MHSLLDMTMRLHSVGTYVLSTIENRLLAISTILADTKSHQYTPDTQKTTNIDNLEVRRKNPHTKSGNKDIDNNSESTAKIKPVMIGIILLSILPVVIILLIMCTYPVERYQTTKYMQKEDSFNI